MQVLVAGGTGFIGSHLCRELVDAGHDVTAMSRSPDEDEVPEEVAVTMGDVTAADSVAGAVDGHDVVVNLVALSPLFKPDGGDEMHQRVHLGGTENLVAAAEDAGVERFVQMSALGADPNGATHYIRAKGAAETVVAESDVDGVVIRPSVVFGEGGEFVSFTKRLKKLFAPGVPVYPLPGGGQTRFQPVWVGDLVPMLVEAIEDDDHLGETYELGGPEQLTLREITNMVFDAEGRSVQVVGLPMGLAKVGLSVMGATGVVPMGQDQYRSLQFDNTTADNDIGAFGVGGDELTALGEYLSAP
ncbi:MAG: complex I NDUFA9 subunit family protein [Halolamina sp.]